MKKNNTKYKVCILAAGAGTRMDYFSNFINKGVLPVNNKAVISYIIEKFPIDTEIIIAVGHKKNTVIDYLKLAHSNRIFKFVEVDKYTGRGSGPGYSLLACKKYLDSPFIFSTADTIVLEDIPLPEENWIGIAPVHETEPYCTIKMKNNLVYQLDTKIKTDNKFAFIGLAGIHDHKDFFSALEQNKELQDNELQMTNGLKGLLDKKLTPIGFTWFDTGSRANYIKTNKNFSGGEEQKFDFSKEDEFLYFVNNRVIKFFADKTVVEKRNHRATNNLLGLSPVIEGCRNNFYSYVMVEGQTVYNTLNPKIMTDFLSWAKTYLWKDIKLTKKEKNKFSEACYDFYHNKTKKRLEMFYNKTNTVEDSQFINGMKIPTTTELLNEIDWDYITNGTPSNFHGDLQFDNVLIPKDSSSNKQKFLLLDWRHEFGGLTDMGDLYYDLAKLYGGMILSYPLIKKGMFSSSVCDEHAYYDFFVKSDLLEAKEYYEQFLQDNDFDIKKIKIITSLIFLNMAPLHNSPFDSFLLNLGRNMLYKSLKIKYYNHDFN